MSERLAGEYIRGGVAGGVVEAEGGEGHADPDGSTGRPTVQETNSDGVFALGSIKSLKT